MTRTKAGASNPTANEALETLLDSLMSRIRESPAKLEVDDLLERFALAVGRDVGPVEVQLRTVAQVYDQQASRSRGEVLVNMTLGKLGDVLAAADQLLTKWPESDALAAAEAELCDAERARRETLTGLELAVERGDVDLVIRLRTEAEVAAPRRIEVARLAVLDLQVARATDLAEVPARRLRSAKERRAAAEQVHEAAKAAVELAEKELEDAAWRQRIAEIADTRMASAAENLRQQRDAAKVETQKTSEERLRRLAGLAPAQTNAKIDSSEPKQAATNAIPDRHLGWNQNLDAVFTERPIRPNELLQNTRPSTAVLLPAYKVGVAE